MDEPKISRVCAKVCLSGGIYYVAGAGDVTAGDLRTESVLASAYLFLPYRIQVLLRSRTQRQSKKATLKQVGFCIPCRLEAPLIFHVGQL